MQKKIFVLIVTLLMCLSSIVIIRNDSKVEAASGDSNGGENNSGIGLDLDYIWNETVDLANVIYNAYPIPDEIPRGRFFGSKGGNYTVNNILLHEMNVNLSLEDVHTEQIKAIPNSTKNYTTVVWANDYQLTVNNPNYPPQITPLLLSSRMWVVRYESTASKNQHIASI